MHKGLFLAAVAFAELGHLSLLNGCPEHLATLCKICCQSSCMIRIFFKKQNIFRYFIAGILFKHAVLSDAAITLKCLEGYSIQAAREKKYQPANVMSGIYH